MAPGFYPDPQNPHVQRWWDGTQWTAQVRQGGIVTPTTPSSARATAWILGVVVGLFALLVGAVALGVLLFARAASPRPVTPVLSRPYAVIVSAATVTMPTPPKVGDTVRMDVHLKNVDSRGLGSFRLSLMHGVLLEPTGVDVGTVESKASTSSEVLCQVSAEPGDEAVCGVLFEAKGAGHAIVAFAPLASDGVPFSDAAGKVATASAKVTVAR